MWVSKCVCMCVYIYIYIDLVLVKVVPVLSIYSHSGAQKIRCGAQIGHHNVFQYKLQKTDQDTI